MTENVPKISDIFKAQAAVMAADDLRRRPFAFGEIARRVGQMTLDDGETVDCHIIPSTDALVTDGTSMILISRDAENPTQRARFPGGFVDAQDASPIMAALRELQEETGVVLNARDYKVRVAAALEVDGPVTVRRAFKDLPERGIKKGDVFIVAFQPVVFEISPELMATLEPVGHDDAAWAGIEKLADIRNGSVKIPPHHYKMLRTAGLLVDESVPRGPLLS
ncbi:MAG: NUDIX domain-containing protein [Rhodospirillales bacterium]|nr:NUDIX domain-containing protein [Rhodospirillales bacterium]MCB9996361.1 NUDIX domain-containing protein [Rhodospirillales bacterium]